jgi:hypothetical protein
MCSPIPCATWTTPRTGLRLSHRAHAMRNPNSEDIQRMEASEVPLSKLAREILSFWTQLDADCVKDNRIGRGV